MYYILPAKSAPSKARFFINDWIPAPASRSAAKPFGSVAPVNTAGKQGAGMTPLSGAGHDTPLAPLKRGSDWIPVSTGMTRLRPVNAEKIKLKNKD